MYYVKQLNNQDCGFACLKMVLAKLFKDNRYLYLKQDLKHGPYTYKELITIAKENGVVINGYLYNDVEELFRCKESNVMACLQSDDGGKHLVVIKKIICNRVYIKDPFLGRYVLSKKKFLRLWDKTILKVDKIIYYEHKEIKPLKVNTNYNITMIFLRILSLFSSILVLFCVGTNIKFWFLILFVFIALFSEFLYRFCAFKAMKKIDKNYLEQLENKDLSGNEFITYYSNFKKDNALLWPSFAFSFFFSIFLVVMLVLNSEENFISIILILLVACLDTLIINPRFSMKQKSIETNEYQIQHDVVDNNFIKKLISLNNCAYKFAFQTMLRKCLIYGSIICISLTMMWIKDATSVTFLAFHIFAYYSLFSNLSYIFSFNERRNEYNAYRIILMNIIKDKKSN